MRAYSASDEEALRAQELLKDWAGEDLLTPEQHQQMEQETVCDLRRTNIFMRLVLFLFTLIIVIATVFLLGGAFGIFWIMFGVASYLTAEGAVSQYKLYRYGIEEALLACSVGLFCMGIQSILSSSSVLAPAIGVILSLWIWHRFGLPYASLAAMIFVVWLPGYWTSYPWAQHLVIAAFYAVGLVTVAIVRTRHRFSYLNDRFSLTEAFLWLGIYLAINLQISALNMGPLTLHATSDFPRPLYWTTWVLTWCLPPIVLARGLCNKDRFVIIAGVLTAVLTLFTNKPYLGWLRHTWDPMLLGVLLFGTALFVRRWLANGPGGVRRGFTARRLSGKDKSWMSAGAATIGFLSPNIITPSSQPDTPDVHFGGGKSGGGGASSDY